MNALRTWAGRSPQAKRVPSAQRLTWRSSTPSRSALIQVSRVRSRADYDGGGAVLVSRGCSPGESVVASLAAAAAPARASRASAGVRVICRGGRAGT
jgi:hypothetical protein